MAIAVVLEFAGVGLPSPPKITYYEVHNNLTAGP